MIDFSTEIKNYKAAAAKIKHINDIRTNGRIKRVIGLTLESEGPQASIGELCSLILPNGKRLPAEVVGFKEHSTLLMPLGELEGINPGTEVKATGAPMKIKVGDELLGRVLDGMGEPLDDKGPVEYKEIVPVLNDRPHPLKRKRIKEPLSVGIKSIDGLLTVGRGQRMGIFAGSGVGKSTLLGMISRFTEAEVNVIALIGERGREVREFIDKDLGEEGLRRSVVVVATSDMPPLTRLRAAFVATRIAEYFRDSGKDVLLLMDSITRLAHAQREIGLAIGEPPSTRGYTPSVFALFPKLLERAGASERGTLTAFYTILVEADDMNEPVADTARGILDGHIVLSRDLAQKGHYPAVDVLASISRLMIDVVDDEHTAAATKVKSLMAIYKEAEDLISIGAYQKGSNPDIDLALEKIQTINGFLKQGIKEYVPYSEIVSMLMEIV